MPYTALNWINLPDVGNNLVADLLVVLLSFVILLLLSTPKRNRLFAFFGFKINPNLVFYLSRIGVVQGINRDGQTDAFSGAAVPHYEFEAIPKAIGTLNSITSSGSVANRLVNAILGYRARIEFLTAPEYSSGIEHANLVVIGGPAYNVATNEYLSSSVPLLQFAENGGITVQRGQHKGRTFQTTKQDDMAILERVYDSHKNITVFIVAGANVNGTRGALEYLLDNWEGLYQKHATRPFAVCLRFPQPHIDPVGYRNPTVVLEIEP